MASVYFWLGCIPLRLAFAYIAMQPAALPYVAAAASTVPTFALSTTDDAIHGYIAATAAAASRIFLARPCRRDAHCGGDGKRLPGGDAHDSLQQDCERGRP